MGKLTRSRLPKSQRYYTRTDVNGNFKAGNWEYLGHPNDFMYDHDNTCPLFKRNGFTGTSTKNSFNGIAVFVLCLGAKYM